MLRRVVLVITFLTYVSSLTFSNERKASHVKMPHETLRRRLSSSSALYSSASLSVATDPAGKRGGESSLGVSTFNLAKSIIGAGVLSLPSGVAFFSDQPQALVPSVTIATVFGLVAAYCFSLIGKVCEEYNARTFQEV
jgi:hypothetical protein